MLQEPINWDVYLRTWRTDLKQSLIENFGSIKSYTRRTLFPSGTLSSILYGKSSHLPIPYTAARLYQDTGLRQLKIFAEVQGWNADFKTFLRERSYTYRSFADALLQTPAAKKAQIRQVERTRIRHWANGAVISPFKIEEELRDAVYEVISAEDRNAKALKWFAPVTPLPNGTKVDAPAYVTSR